VLTVGYSHPVTVTSPAGIKFSVEKNVITVEGLDKDLVGLIAAKIKAVRRPDPYKGKGIRYQGEVLKLKPGKQAAKAGGSA
jgi:large subunit ribosomal protein L6